MHEWVEHDVLNGRRLGHESRLFFYPLRAYAYPYAYLSTNFLFRDDALNQFMISITLLFSVLKHLCCIQFMISILLSYSLIFFASVLSLICVEQTINPGNYFMYIKSYPLLRFFCKPSSSIRKPKTYNNLYIFIFNPIKLLWTDFVILLKLKETELWNSVIETLMETRGKPG